MNGKYIIGVDGGTQSTKVSIFDLKGSVICEGKQALRPTMSRQLGYVEHPDDDLWDSLIAASREAMSKFPGTPEEILGLGLCTIRCCRVYMKADGSLAAPVMSWMDIRSYKPYEADDPEICYATTTTGYMTHKLTGNFCDTVSNNTNRQWPVDHDTWEYTTDEQIFRDWNLPREKTLKLQMPGTILGTLTKEAAQATGLPEGIPVVATASDKAVEALGAGLHRRPDTGLVSLGTYISSMVSGPENRTGASYFWTNLACMPHRYLFESYGIRRGMWTVSWFKDLFMGELAPRAQQEGIPPEEILNREAEKVSPGCDGLMTVMEWLATADKNYKKGIMMGFDIRHGRGHMYRSILEGIALTMKNRYDEMCGELGIAPGQVIISGGGSNSNVFMQIFADVFGIPAVRNVVNAAAGVGAAICVAVATGAYSGFEEAMENMVQIRDSFAPNMENHALYTKMNREVYSTITQTTDDILKRSYPIFG